MNFEELKKICEKLLELNLDLLSHIAQNKIDEIQFLIDKKKVLNQTLKNLFDNSSLTKKQENYLNEIIIEIGKKEQEVIIEFEKKKEQIGKKISNISKNSTKLISAYTIKTKESKPKIFDSRE